MPRTGQVQGIGKIHALPEPAERAGEDLRVLHRYALHAGQFGQLLGDLFPADLIGAAEHPFGFETDGNRQEYVAAQHNLSGALRLIRVVVRKEADDDVGINSDQGAWLPA